MAEVKIKLSAFITKSVCFDNGVGGKLTINPASADTGKVGEGKDTALFGDFELMDQDLVFYQDTKDSPIFLKELNVVVKKFNLIFIDLEYLSHSDKKMNRGLISALDKKLNQV